MERQALLVVPRKCGIAWSSLGLVGQLRSRCKLSEAETSVSGRCDDNQSVIAASTNGLSECQLAGNGQVCERFGCAAQAEEYPLSSHIANFWPWQLSPPRSFNFPDTRIVESAYENVLHVRLIRMHLTSSITN